MKMAQPRERPYSQFNFIVDLGLDGHDPETTLGGFQEVSGLGMEITVAEYRNGNERENAPRKITGTVQGARRDPQARRRRDARALRVAGRDAQRTSGPSSAPSRFS